MLVYAETISAKGKHIPSTLHREGGSAESQNLNTYFFCLSIFEIGMAGSEAVSIRDRTLKVDGYRMKRNAYVLDSIRSGS